MPEPLVRDGLRISIHALHEESDQLVGRGAPEGV